MPSPLERSEWDEYVDIFGALSADLRLRILSMIACREEAPCTLLEETLPISKSTISYHVKILQRAGLITVRKEGRYFFYRLRAEVIEHFLPGFTYRLLSDTDKQLQAAAS